MSPSDHPLNETNESSLPLPATDVLEQLAKILSSEPFKRSPRNAAFLKFVVEETLAGRSDFIKARTIGMAVFDRQPEEAPEDDPIVRIQAGRLRKRLSQYYEDLGAGDSIHISIPTGSYIPVIEPTSTAGPAGRAGLRASRGLPRIAVLPLANQGGSSKYDVFVDGLGQELSAELARYQGLAVLAYWSTSRFRIDSLDVLSAGRELAADFLVCGSLARSDDRVRIQIECVHVETGDQIWAEHFDRSLTTNALFDIQDEIVQQVVERIGGYYGSVPHVVYQSSRCKNVRQLTAYESVLANHHYLRRLDKETHDHTRAALEHAVEIEPDYALAWAMLSALYCDIYAYDLSPLDEPRAHAEECARRAMSLDQHCQHAHYASALLGALTKDHPRIIAACDNVIRLNPNAAFMVGSSAIWLGMAERFDDALQLFRHSLELNPYHPGWFHFLPWLHAFTEREFERALAAAHQMNMPTFFWDAVLRAATLGKLGRRQQAEAAYAELLKLKPEFAVRPDFYLGCYVHSDDTRAEVLDGLRTAGLRS